MITMTKIFKGDDDERVLGDGDKNFFYGYGDGDGDKKNFLR